MLDDAQLEKIMHALTLRDRGEKRRADWIARGFKRIHARPGALFAYWKARLATDPEAAELAGVIWQEYVSRDTDNGKGGNSSGPGSQLKRMLYSLGLRPAPGCRCNARAAEMDARGVQWCEQNEATIIGWLREEAVRARLPFSVIAARLLVRRAIRLAKKLAA